ncbi:RidA family protein [Consotaella salsifontis]|nr:RidA family protein [Consotaella salsifontis]
MNIIASSQAPKAIGPYSQAVAVGDWLFTSGQIPLDLEGNIVGSDIEAQARQVFANLKAVLAEAGTSLDRVVKATVFLADLKDFEGLNKVYAAEFGSHAPARSCFEVSRLPRDVKVEIELVVSLR